MAFKVISTNQTVQQLVNGADEVVLLEGVSVALADTAFLGTHDTTCHSSFTALWPVHKTP